MLDKLLWSFPLEAPHFGMPFGNGRLGLLVHGEKNTLKITVSRADLWDHRGGMPWTDKQNYKDIRKALSNKDKDALEAIFATTTEHTPGQPPRPSVIPMGRYEIDLGENARLVNGTLDFKTGAGFFTFTVDGETKHFSIHLARNTDRFILRCSEPISSARIRFVPSWDIVPLMKEYSFKKPLAIHNGPTSINIQKMPVDPHAANAFTCAGNDVLFEVERSCDIQLLTDKLTAPDAKVFELECVTESAGFWKTFMASLPAVNVPDDVIERNYTLGMYKFASFANASHGVPGTLQGPWIEEYRLPPWSSDYHFNINVQMCYAPALAAGLYGELKQLFSLILSWTDILKANAEKYIGIKDGRMLPHAVDDKCMCMGSFWTGTVDHACTAWVAAMMFDYVRYTNDIDFLKNDAYEFMLGAFNVYYAMLEKDAATGKFTLPLGVSPEYMASEINAWGENASFQLAAIHRLAKDLIQAADMLGVERDARLLSVEENLPDATYSEENFIALWKGKIQEDSHRHHSHLAGITPFETFDLDDRQTRERISNTLTYNWLPKGIGLWTAWSFPWASQIHSRLANPGAATLFITLWDKLFVNKGYGSDYECPYPGLTMNYANPFDVATPPPQRIMQLDSAFGTVDAIRQLFIHSRADKLVLGAGVPQNWGEASISDFNTPFGVKVSASFRNGKTKTVELNAGRNTQFTIVAGSAREYVTLSKGEKRTLAFDA